jgi:hypothetical protein
MQKIKCETETRKWYHSLFGLPWKVSELEELQSSNLSNEDYLLISDMSQKKSMKVKLGSLKEFLRS